MLACGAIEVSAVNWRFLFLGDCRRALNRRYEICTVQLIWLTVVNREQYFLSLFFGFFCVSLIQGIDRDETGLATFDQSDIRVSRRMTCLRRGAASL
jgi:hypothetical protein